MTESDREITLKEFVAATEGVFRMCRWAADEPEGVDFPSLYLHRHMIAMADAVEVLCSVSVVIGTIPPLRSMLEALIALKYIHMKDYEKRSRSWLYDHQKQEIKKKEMMDRTTERGKDFQRVAAKELPGLVLPQFDSKKGTEDAMAVLKEADMVPVETEFNEFEKEHGRAPAWYQIFNGVKDRYHMAEKVGLATLYKLLYGPWSGTVHAMDPNAIISMQHDDSAEFRDLRDPHYLDFTKDSVLELLRMGTKIMVDRFLPEEKIARLEKSLTS